MLIPELTARERVSVLACSRLALAGNTAEPLKAGEWATVVRALGDHGVSDPSDLIGRRAEAIAELGVSTPLAVRLAELLGRATALAIEIEALRSKGMWVTTRDSAQYPARWRQRLGDSAPVVLCGLGDADLLNRDAVAVVGSRDVDEEGNFFASLVAARAGSGGLGVVSGGARGVDSIAVEAALAEGGWAVEVIADRLDRVARDRTTRQAIESGRLSVVTPYHPAQGFSVATAMGRNRLIYTFSIAAFVAASDEGKGGTWAGATENLRARWVPLFVRTADRVPPGNRALVSRGATSVTTESLPAAASFRAFVLGEDAAPAPVAEASAVRESAPEWSPLPASEPAVATGALPEAAAAPPDAFSIVWPHVKAFCEQPRTEADVAAAFALEPKQAKAWLKRAVDEKLLSKRTRPIRYTSIRTLF